MLSHHSSLPRQRRIEAAFAAVQRLRTKCEPRWFAALPGPLRGGESGTTGPQGNRHAADSFAPAHGEGMDARVEATQERLPDVLSKSPAATHGLVGRSPARADEDGLRFGDFLLATQEKVTRAPKAHESVCFYQSLVSSQLFQSKLFGSEITFLAPSE